MYWLSVKGNGNGRKIFCALMYISTENSFTGCQTCNAKDQDQTLDIAVSFAVSNIWWNLCIITILSYLFLSLLFTQLTVTSGTWILV